MDNSLALQETPRNKLVSIESVMRTTRELGVLESLEWFLTKQLIVVPFQQRFLSFPDNKRVTMAIGTKRTKKEFTNKRNENI
eukprot:2520002-Amphidinium_carterae.1